MAERGLNINLGGPYDFGRGGPGGWWIIPEPEVHCVRDVELAVPPFDAAEFCLADLWG